MQESVKNTDTKPTTATYRPRKRATAKPVSVKPVEQSKYKSIEYGKPFGLMRHAESCLLRKTGLR